MSLLGNLAGGLANQALGSLFGGGGGQSNQILSLLTTLVGQSGGIDGIVKKFAAAGMGQHAQQWVATGPNPPITGDQFTQVFGAHQVQQIASQLGVQPQQAAGGLAALLPTVIDKLTPNGQPVHGNDLNSGIEGLMKNGIGGLGLGDLGTIAKLFGR